MNKIKGNLLLQVFGRLYRKTQASKTQELRQNTVYLLFWSVVIFQKNMIAIKLCALILKYFLNF